MTGLAPVYSSAITAIGWANGILTVVFHGGRVYDHPGVPYLLYLALLLAPSKGGFYNAHIRGRYK
jgi:hypothetical protein